MADKDLAAFLREHVIVIPVGIPPAKKKPDYTIAADGVVIAEVEHHDLTEEEA